jgi:hypothetical protein
MLARAELDTALDFTGHPATAQVGRCCLGCFMYQRCFNVVPRLAQICILTALPTALAPWAATSLYNQMPAGFNGLTGCLAAAWSASALLLVMDCIATPMAFMRKYERIPFPYPDATFDERTRDVLCGLFASTPP